MLSVDNHRHHRPFLHYATFSMSICVLIALYCIIWLGFVKKVRKLEVAAVWAAPVMTVTGLAAWLLYVPLLYQPLHMHVSIDTSMKSSFPKDALLGFQ